MPSREEIRAYRCSHPSQRGRHGKSQATPRPGKAEPAKPALGGLRTQTTTVFGESNALKSIGLPTAMILGLLSTCTMAYDKDRYEYPATAIVEHVNGLSTKVIGGYDRTGFEVDLRERPRFKETIEGNGYRLTSETRGVLTLKNGDIFMDRRDVIPGEPIAIGETYAQLGDDKIGAPAAWLGGVADSWNAQDIVNSSEQSAGSLVIYTLPDADREKIGSSTVQGVYGRDDVLEVVIKEFNWGPVAWASISVFLIGFFGSCRQAVSYFGHT